ncbi:MFS transporter [Gilliamella apicola]|uniref:MFS transporter n=1 Tax=Gilliamella apicola TaxID=1196095 RepID=UPI000A357E4B|nr:MFS transporter [Gilliamella apicola]OTP87462.1 MFS transporter [Gilliamella apicola]OTP92464.1 MFS transporter [Gilliamella apicola]OTP95136.1 MFS transporter [Gilliamella apicola]OTQ01603.1 MFS transporter [Gilliamella apicola]OTQ04695.1 MFS transporter [Gilliamella apicola]
MIKHSKHSTPKSYWIKLVVIFFLGWIVIYAGRSVLSPLVGELQTQFGLTKAQTGGIISLFFLAYTLFQIPSGVFGDRIGRKRVLVTGFSLYAIFIACVYFASSFSIFLIFWILVGAAQGCYYGPQYALSTEAIPKKWITLGSAIIGSGMSFGIAMGYYLSSVMISVFNTSWKIPFVMVAIPIVIVTLLMIFCIKEKGSALVEIPSSQKTNFSKLFKNRNLVLVYITIFCSIYGFFVIITWLPNYLEVEKGMNKIEASQIASIVPWISIIGTILCSYISDKLGRRKPVILFMMPLSLIAIFSIVYCHSYIELIAVLVLYGFIGKISLNPVLIALVADNAPKVSLSTAFGLYNFFGMTASICAPYFTGLIADKTGSLNSGFYLAAVITMVGITAMLFVRERQTAN